MVAKIKNETHKLDIFYNSSTWKFTSELTRKKSKINKYSIHRFYIAPSGWQISDIHDSVKLRFAENIIIIDEEKKIACYSLHQSQDTIRHFTTCIRPSWALPLIQ